MQVNEFDSIEGCSELSLRSGAAVPKPAKIARIVTVGCIVILAAIGLFIYLY